MLTSESIKSLKINNYLRQASEDNNYWFDFSYKKLEKYNVALNGNFNLVIYSKLNSIKYYAIPFQSVKDIFQKKYLTKSKSGAKKRWVGNIIDDVLKIGKMSLDIKEYYSTPLNAVNSLTQLLETVNSDLEAYSFEEYYSQTEGGSQKKLVNFYERKPRLRAKAIELHGTSCIACGFDFHSVYGVHGKNYIEVHHIVPLSKMNKSIIVNPQKDMTVLCANCHRMVHRKKDYPLSIEELIIILKKK